LDRALPDFFKDVKDGEKSSFKIVLLGKSIFLSVVSRHLIFKGKNLKLVALTDVSSELAAKEADAWQKLLRVLTHEISNSAIPFSTLSSYIYDMVTKSEAENRKLTQEERMDILESLHTIDQRSKSLREFMQHFKSVNQIPEPILSRINVNDLLAEVSRLFAPDLQNENIALRNLNGETDFTIYADKSLTMQVLIKPDKKFNGIYGKS